MNKGGDLKSEGCSDTKHGTGECEASRREVRHQMKNNIQVIVSLVDMEAGLCADPAARHGFARLGQRVMAMSCVYDAIEPTGDQSQADLARCLEQLIGRLREAAPGDDVELVLDAEPVQMHLDKAFPCALLVTELAANAVRHAFAPAPGSGPEKPRVVVSLRHDAAGERGVLVVADNGRGLPAGIDPGKTRSPGLHLAWMWATHQLRGTLEVTRGAGTVFQIVFPLRKTKVTAQSTPKTVVMAGSEGNYSANPVNPVEY